MSTLVGWSKDRLILYRSLSDLFFYKKIWKFISIYDMLYKDVLCEIQKMFAYLA
jgi:hypothetical protein